MDPINLTGGDDINPFIPAKKSLTKPKEADWNSRQGGSPLAKKAHMETPAPNKGSKSKSCQHHGTSQDDQDKSGGPVKRPVYKDMEYLTFTPVTKLEKKLFKKCSFDQPPVSHPSPLRNSDKPSLSSKSMYSKVTQWLQGSKANRDHFWKEDTALVKAFRQYHFALNILEGHTQWKFQKSHILHWVLDVIAIHMQDTKRCLDYCSMTLVNQDCRCQDPNLHHLKAMAIGEVKHLTMVIMLDVDDTHYSDAFGNIFEEETLCKKWFPAVQTVSLPAKGVQPM